MVDTSVLDLRLKNDSEHRIVLETLACDDGRWSDTCIKRVGVSIVDSRSVRHIAQGVLAKKSARPHSGATALPEENSEENRKLYVSAISIPNENTKSEKLLQNHQLPYENLQRSAQTRKL